VAPGAAVGAATAGTPLPAEVAEPIATSLGVDLSSVRVHSDGSAAQAARAFGARAFAIGSNVFLGQGERATDLRLMAHEVAHVVQQRAARTVQAWTNKTTDRSEREADRASAAVARRQSFSIREHVSSRVQRLGISDALDYFADKANLIPGFRMLTILIGVNPINMSRVERSAANILRAIVEFIPGGALITQALDKYGVFERAGAWTEQQLTTLGMTGAMFREALDRFLDSLSWRDIFHLGDVWDRAKRIFMDPISRIINFVVGLGVGILRLIRDAILKPLASLAEGTRGWDLLKAVLGQDPITGEAVPRNADTLIGGFMKLIGQEEVWNNIKRANAIPRAWAWFQGALAELLGFVRQIPTMFITALRELEIVDIVVLPRAFAKVGRVFLGFAGNFFAWALRQVLSLLQIIFEVVAPAVMPYLRKAMGAFRQIIQHPVGFVGNLVRAGVQGFKQFMGNFLSHLRRSLIQWLTGTLEGAGIYIPQAFELREIIKFVLSVLGLTWQNVRGKLLRLIPEPVLSALETGFDIVVTLVREGPAAAWEKIREQISNLKDMVMEQIMSFVRESIVTAAITKLLTSLNPAGAFIQAIIAIYNTIMFFVERLRQIAQVVASFIDSISAIASGAIGAAANRVEQTMAGFLTLVISFLARLVGLGRVSDAVKKIVDRIRAPIDKALDRVVEWIVATARRLTRFVVQAGVPQDPNERLRLGKQSAIAAVNRFAGQPVAASTLNSLLTAISVRYGFTRLEVMARQGRWVLVGAINPSFEDVTESLTPEAVTGPPGSRTLLVGEGNFTFALTIALVTKVGPALAATDYIVQARQVLNKSPREASSEAQRNVGVQDNIAKLQSMGVEVDRQVDVRDPATYPAGTFDTIVFNHPFDVYTDADGKRYLGAEKLNRALVVAFLEGAKQRLREGGRIVIISSQYRLQRWRIDDAARALGLETKVMSFLASNFPGYVHEKTLSSKAARTVAERKQFAVVFTISARRE
jgi:hypothetical protein